MTYIDHSLYPDMENPPAVFSTVEEQADYIHRLCSAWDYGVLPEPATVDLLRDWKLVFDQFPIPASPAYRAFRDLYGWEPVAIPPGLRGPTPRYMHFDRIEGRTDPCENLI